MYPYIKFSDETTVTIKKDNDKEINVYFERQRENNLDTANCKLPEYNWTNIEGYEEKRIKEFEEFLHHNLYLFKKYVN